MVKKKVPDWLNSSIWSTNSPRVGDNLAIDASKSASPVDSDCRKSVSGAAESSAVDPPIPQPPPIVSQEESRNDASRKECEHDVGSSTNSLSAEDVSQQAQLLCEISRKTINLRELRRIASQGIPLGGGARSMVWKLVLGYMPSDRALWSSELAKKRSQYKHFKEDVLMNPSEVTRRLSKTVCLADDKSKLEGRGLLARTDVSMGEHPLSLGTASIWNKHFQDMEIIEQIDRDVKRTHPDMHFFSGGSSLAKSNQEALRSILIVFAKLNPGIRYVQGMNEVLAPLFYVFRDDPDEDVAVGAEADAFFCFVELLSGFRDHFCQQLDNSDIGIRSTMSRLSLLLRQHDEELWRHLEITTKVNPQFYAFRWITLLLTQEFNFAECLHVWDYLLSHPEGLQETLLRVCCAMLILVRRRLLAGDFTYNLKLLQHYPSTNISHLLYVANKLLDKMPKRHI